MHCSALLILLSTLPVAFAQGYGDSGNSPATTSSSHPTTTSASVAGVHTVTVGANGALAFSPNTITAAVGDIVEYIFFPQTHSVAQSTFAEPCTPFSNGTSFFSGGMTTASGQNAKTFQITINDTSPIWFFCAFPGQ
jgi:plastocyanin